ncbi:FHA domain-containing protein [Candidatus Halobeggiatoa sp. HSG11]|nr:FHA domain-containing protein [Candidatus Halobeggiatoa sp. HSG11]
MNKQFTIGNSPENTYHIVGIEENTNLTVTSLSASEYLICSANNNLIVGRQRVAMARIDKYTPLQLDKISFTLDELLKNKGILPKTKFNQKQQQTDYKLDSGRIYLAGASDVCDIRLSSPRVAWHAVEIQHDGSQWQLRLIQTNKKITVVNGDKLRVGPYQLIFKDNGQVTVMIATNDRLTMKNIGVLHPKKRKNPPLIRDLSLSFQAGEFMGIIGPSGAGKSTLLKAIRAIIPVNSGQITLSQNDTRKNSEILKEIGFVPQDDVVIEELTVAENLRYAAQLKLPADWPAEAIEQKVDELVKAMNLDQQRNNFCSNISGGQRKRVNLALEMMLEPTFLLADEVCSGLSSLDTDNILQHLRWIADSGKGIMLTIHSPDIEAFDLMDTLLVLDTGGFIAYYGPAQPDALQYFSKQTSSPYRSPKLIFDILEKKEGEQRKTLPEDWHLIYKSSPYYQEYIQAKLSEESQNE